MMINNKFYKDTMLLIFSSAISQIILILSVPLISRIYTTSEFGNFTLFNNLALVFIPIINARFDLMIIKASSKKEANALSQISLKISFYIIAVILPLGLIISIIFSDYLFEILSLSLLLILVSLSNVFTSYLNLTKKYKHISMINVSRSFIMVFLQVIFGFMNFGYVGLIMGFTLSYIAGLSIGYKQFKNAFTQIKDSMYLKEMFHLNIKQLKYSTPSILMNSLSLSLIVFFIGILYSSHDVGLYGMATRILNVPVVVAGLGLSKIFMQKANEDYRAYNSFRNILFKFSILLFLLAFIVYVPLLILNEKIILIFLGKEWIEVATLFLPLVILYITRLVVSTVSLSNIVIGKQKLDLFFQFLLLVISVISSGLALMLNWEFTTFVLINSVGLTFGYIIFYILIFYFARNKNQEEIK